ncbi:MAG: hypothetical protein LBL58_04465 [Tannerellaceae bacterium]|nr:hypothetical protein [Tannerellaceae bacterium]
MKTHPYRIGRFNFITKLHAAVTIACLAMAIALLICAFFNPYHLIYGIGSIALTIASYKEKLW